MEVHYIRHLLMSEGIKADPKNVEAAQNKYANKTGCTLSKGIPKNGELSFQILPNISAKRKTLSGTGTKTSRKHLTR